MTRPQPPPRKPAKVWEPAEWLLALQDGEAQRLQARFEKEAATSKPRRPPETPSEQRIRFEAEFLKAKEQREVQELRKVAKKRPAAADERVSIPPIVLDTALDFLQHIRRGVVEGLLVPASMARQHGRAGHVSAGGRCGACSDVVQTLLLALDNDSSAFPSLRGEVALAVIDKAIDGARQSPTSETITFAAQAAPTHSLTADQVLTALGLGSQPPADA